MIAILCTDGQMNLNEVRNECVPGKWAPIFVYRKNPEDLPIVPIFTDQDIARQFIKRNLPKDWIHGVTFLADEDYQWMKDQGWILRKMTYPNCVTNFKIGVEILEFQNQPIFKAG